MQPQPPPSPPPKSTTSTSSASTSASTTTTPHPDKTSTLTPIPPSAALPSPATLLAAASTLLYTATSATPIPFSSLYTTPNRHTTTLLLFIRHFFCGNCQEFLRRLASSLPPSLLPKDTRIVIIGCGSPSLIASYVDALACDPPFPYDIYAEPSKNLHQMLGMQYSLSLGSKSPEYMQRSLLRVNLESTVQGLKRLWRGEGDALSGGDMRLNGGEFLVESDPEGKASVVWCHRMENSRGHAEMDVLKGVLALGGKENENEKRNEDKNVNENGNPTEQDGGERRTRRRSTADRLRRSFSSRRQSWLGRNGSVGREKEKDGDHSSRSASRRRRSPDPGMNAVKEEVRSRDGEEEKVALAATDGGVGVVST